MASHSTPQISYKRPDGSQSPGVKADGISVGKNHLPRSEVVQQIYSAARRQQHVVIGSSAATGKTSLLQLLKKRLDQEEEGANVVRINLNSTMTVQHLMEELAEYGIVQQMARLGEVKNTWLLLDDAQNAYDRKFDPFWQFVVKAISSAGVDDNLFVVIAATYDLSTPESPVHFPTLEHVDPNLSEDEARELFKMHAEVWGCQDWGRFLGTLIEISKFSESQSVHVGVIIAGIRMLAEMRNEPGQQDFNEDRALEAVRKEKFTGLLDRCFRLPDHLPDDFKDRLLDVVIGDGEDDILCDASLSPFTRAGLLTKRGNFSNIAARWYYNRRCFPNRAAKAPEGLDQLIMLAVGSISAQRLRDTLVTGFPKEATFQHLFNEAMSQLLPLHHAIIPELNTLVVNPPNGSDVTGELDFYINGKLKWCVELLRNGDKIGEHIRRFDKNDGKYRKVHMRDYIVVDCRGPTRGGGAQPSESRCTLYFAQDFKYCWCQMRMKESFRIVLAN